MQAVASCEGQELEVRIAQSSTPRHDFLSSMTRYSAEQVLARIFRYDLLFSVLVQRWSLVWYERRDAAAERSKLRCQLRELSYAHNPLRSTPPDVRWEYKGSDKAPAVWEYVGGAWPK